MHVGWVPDESGGYHAQMAVLVKPNGPLGTAYMAAIKPFRPDHVPSTHVMDPTHVADLGQPDSEFS
jgi:hypothetical protein